MFQIIPGRCPKPSLLPAQVFSHSNMLILFVRETVSYTKGLHKLNFCLNFLQASPASGGERCIWVCSASMSFTGMLSAHLQHFFLLLCLSIAVRENFRTDLGVFIFWTAIDRQKCSHGIADFIQNGEHNNWNN